MKGLAVIDRDLVLFGNDYLTLTGAPRIRQDLSFALNDEYGSLQAHPYWGSILNRLIGQPLTAGLQQQVLAEVQRVVNNYINVQADMVNRAVVIGVRGNLNNSDVVRSVTSINADVNMSTLRVALTLQTMANETVTITRTVSV